MSKFTFTMTDNAKARMFNHFSEDGLLDVEIRRHGDEFIIAAVHRGEDVLTMGPLHLDNASTLELHGLRLFLEVDAID